MKKRGMGLMAVTIICIASMALGAFVAFKVASPKGKRPVTEAELINEIMDIPGKIEENAQAYQGAIKDKVDLYKGIETQLVTSLKVDLRKLHAINPAKADKIVDENFPGLWGDGRTVDPIWKRAKPPAPPVAQSAVPTPISAPPAPPANPAKK